MIKELTNLEGYTVEDDYGTMVIYKDDEDFPYCDLATFVFSNYSDENAEKMSRDELVSIIEKSNIEAAKEVGALIAKRAAAKNIKTVVYDRSGYIYHGVVKELAEAAREGGLEF